jgi:dihydrolipoamide dehydrogenase
MTNAQPTRVAVLGAGPGGYAAAFHAADLGMSVTLIDEASQPGGVCLFCGCIPSKALLHAAHTIEESRRAAAWGIHFADPQIDLNALRGWKQRVVDRLTRGLGSLARQRRVRYIQGRGQFTDAHTLHVRTADEVTSVTFDYAILATGSQPARPGPLRLDSPLVMDSTAALEIADVPPTLLVVGGGYIGLELGSVYASLGSQVTVVEMTSGLLPGADRDLVEPLEKRLRGQFAEILLNTRVAAIEEYEGGIRATLASTELDNVPRDFAKVLVAVGRVPNTRNLGLEHTAVQVTARGFVTVDHMRRTTEPSIFAIGDVAGEPMLAHKATHEGRVAVEAIAGQPAIFDPAGIPAVVFTDPEIAWCGLTEAQAHEQGIPVEVSRFPWAASGRTITMGRNDGLTKLLIEPRTERILGIGIVGSGAGELIGEAVLALEMGTRVEDLHLTVHAHPTLSETLMEAASLYYGQSPHYIARPPRG